MNYMLTITRLVSNPQYDREKAEHAARYMNVYPIAPQIPETVLTMTVTPEQFDAIRQACLEVAR